MSAPTIDREEPRHEVKFTFPGVEFYNLLYRLEVHSAGLFRPFPHRRVHSIYFDTADGRAVRENLAGQSDRVKLRYRWYGDDPVPASGALEQKRRENELTLKERVVLDRPLPWRGTTRQAFMAAISDQCPAAWRSMLGEGFEPAQHIAYERHYFASRLPGLRVTVDRALQAWDLRDAYILNSTMPTPMPEMVVVECKALPAHLTALRDVTNALPSSRTRCSKYVMATLPGHYGL